MPQYTTEYRDAWVLGQVEAYAELVQCGKPAACLMVPRGTLRLAVVVAHQRGCRVYAELLPEARDWTVLWVYRTRLILRVIKALPAAREHFPHDVLCWYEGNLFGYPLGEIAAATLAERSASSKCLPGGKPRREAWFRPCSQ